MIKVLVVEDSPTARELLVHILSSDPEIQVVGTAENGEEAVEAVSVKKPDVITMDIAMPGMNGLEATREIMETHPTPIVIVTGSSNLRKSKLPFAALEEGALTVMKKPSGAVLEGGREGAAKELINVVKLMSEVKVVRRWPRFQKKEPTLKPPPKAAPAVKPADIKVVAIGASTGGPQVLQSILSKMAKDYPVPVVIVQHMAAGFTRGFAEWLSQSSAIPVNVAEDGDSLLSGRAYMAPDGFHMEIKRDLRIGLNKGAPENGVRPSVSCLFRSVVRVFGRSAAGVLLTGMGKDGAEELKLMRDSGAVTFAQDKESSIVYGMPGEAVKIDAAEYILSPEKIAAALNGLVNCK